MVNDRMSVTFFREIAANQYAVMLLRDYGSSSVNKLTYLTDTISKVYEQLNYESFQIVRIFTTVVEESSPIYQEGIPTKLYTSYENLAQVIGNTINIEVKRNGELIVSINCEVDIEKLRADAIVYEMSTKLDCEMFYGKTEIKKLIKIPNSDSYFAIQSYKELNLALEDYDSRLARNSTCDNLKSIWFDKKRIFLKQRPEHTFRDSLTRYLKIRLRNAEVRPEQIVDTSHPVDIKVTWTINNKIALIEIKWLGKTLDAIGGTFKQIYTQQRALEGASQLAFYLDENKAQATNKNTVGYLVVFDCRRYNTSTTTSEINLKDGFHYSALDIAYSPDYNLSRNDFAKPVRFFLEPIIN